MHRRPIAAAWMLLVLAMFPSPLAFAGEGPCTVAGQVTLPGKKYGKVVVYAPKVSGAPALSITDLRLDAPEVRQFNKQFVPRSLLIVEGTELAFPNRDHIFHHLYSPGPNDRFELHQHAGGERPTRVFASPGEVTVRCNIHGIMEMWVLVLGVHDVFTVASPTGAFSLTVPADTREVRVWEAGHRERAVPVACGPGATVSIAPKLSVRPGMPPPDYSSH